MVLNKKCRILETLRARAPSVLWAVALLALLGILAGLQGLRTMALVRGTIPGPAAGSEDTRSVRSAILQCRLAEKQLILNLNDTGARARCLGQWRESVSRLLAATRGLTEEADVTDQRLRGYSDREVTLLQQQFDRAARVLERSDGALPESAFQAMNFYEAELQRLSVLAEQYASESENVALAARNSVLTAMATNMAVVLSMMLVPGALVIAGSYRLVKECRDSQARLQAAFNYSHHPMIVTDPRGKIESASQSVKSVFGWETHEIIGQNVNVLMPAPFRGVHDSKVAAHLATGRETLIGQPRELEAMRRDGTTFPCVVTLWKAPLPGIESYLLMAIISDVTEQKANEATIAELNQQVFLAARQAGKAEIATNVLHNVGNALSSVNVASSLIRESLHSACYDDVQRVAQLIETHSENLSRFIAEDVRGRHLPRFLAELFCQLRQHRDAMDGELITLEKSIEHIKAIVESQQQYAKGISRVIEETDVSEVVADAVRISEASLAHHGITVEVEDSPMPMVLLDRHKFLHVMVNLIGNARHACVESNNPDKCVKIRVQHDEERVSVQVRDNGIGIDPAIKDRIFNHGFTTREKGHGFGLHSVALAIEESCGSIEVQSDGVGQGATFFISIPVSAAAQQLVHSC